jgi:hypothetical protein
MWRRATPVRSLSRTGAGSGRRRLERALAPASAALCSLTHRPSARRTFHARTPPSRGIDRRRLIFTCKTSAARYGGP